MGIGWPMDSRSQLGVSKYWCAISHQCNCSVIVEMTVHCFSQTARTKAYQKETIDVEDMIFKLISVNNYRKYNMYMHANGTSSSPINMYRFSHQIQKGYLVFCCLVS